MDPVDKDRIIARLREELQDARDASLAKRRWRWRVRWALLQRRVYWPGVTRVGAVLLVGAGLLTKPMWTLLALAALVVAFTLYLIAQRDDSGLP